METTAWQIPTLIWVAGMISCYFWMYVDSARCDDVDIFNYSYEQFDFNMTEVFLIVFLWPVLNFMMVWRFCRILIKNRDELLLFQGKHD